MGHGMAWHGMAEEKPVLSACISWQAPNRQKKLPLLPPAITTTRLSYFILRRHRHTQTQRHRDRQEASQTSTAFIEGDRYIIVRDAMAAPIYLPSASRSSISHPCMPMAGLDRYASAPKSSSAHAFSTTNPVAMAMYSFSSSSSSSSSSFINKLPAELSSATSNGSRVYCNMQVRHHIFF